MRIGQYQLRNRLIERPWLALQTDLFGRCATRWERIDSIRDDVF